MNNYRRVVELIESGAIGPVKEVHVWCGKSWGGGDRPKETPAVPKGLAWDLWLGPAPSGPTTAPIIRSIGGSGGTSAVERLPTWAVITLTSSFGRSSFATQPASRPSPMFPPTRRRRPSPSKSITSSQPGEISHPSR